MLEYVEVYRKKLDRISSCTEMENLRNVLGSNILLWWLPIDKNRKLEGYK
jgi:hypothetical protein